MMEIMNNNIQAYAKIKGSNDYPNIYGTVTFSQPSGNSGEKIACGVIYVNN